MKINKLTASFGKLENEELRLHDGLNVVYAPNESGKSTWCAFITAMLYGIDTSERSRSGHIPAKTKYIPWSGAPMEGSMDLTADRCDITITRTSRSFSAPMREFTAVYTGTSTPVENLNGSNAGELLTGVSRDVFRRSAFIPQGALAVTGSAELEKRINSIVSTGDESVSSSQALEQLAVWQRKRRSGRRGSLPAVEAQLDEASRRLEEMNSISESMAIKEQELADARQELSALEQQLTETRRSSRRTALRQLNEANAHLAEESRRHDEAVAAYSDAKDAIRASRFGTQKLSEVEAEVSADLAALEQVQKAPRKKASPLPFALLLLLSVVLAGLYTHFSLLPLILASGLTCLAGLFFLYRFTTLRRHNRALEADALQLLKKYRVHSPEELIALLEHQHELWAAASEAFRQEQELRTHYEALLQQKAALEEAALQSLDFSVAGSSPAAELSRRHGLAREKVEKISLELSALKGRLSALGDPLLLETERDGQLDLREELEAEYEALSLAREVLSEAATEMEQRFTPELGRLASDYMRELTGGRYSDVLLNRDFTAAARAEGDIVARESEYLSSGTLDLLYLCVRLAVCELAMPVEEPCPLIIDDALVNLDETRLEQAMTLLKRIARDRQVILFTCRKVEAQKE